MMKQLIKWIGLGLCILGCVLSTCKEYATFHEIEQPPTILEPRTHEHLQDYYIDQFVFDTVDHATFYRIMIQGNPIAEVEASPFIPDEPLYTCDYPPEARMTIGACNKFQCNYAAPIPLENVYPAMVPPALPSNCPDTPVEITWEAYEQATEYEVEVKDQSGNHFVRPRYYTTNKPSVEIDPLPLGEYAVRFRWKSDCSSAWSIPKILHIENPEPIVIPDIGFTITNLQPANRNRINWNIDEGTNWQYEIQIAEDESFEPIVWSTFVRDNYVTAPCLAAGKYKYRVRINEGTCVSEWSNAGRFTMLFQIPEIFGNEEQCPFVPFLINWTYNETCDVDFLVELDDASNFSDPERITVEEPYLYYEPGKPEGVYFARMKAIHEWGESDFSNPISIEVTTDPKWTLNMLQSPAYLDYGSVFVDTQFNVHTVTQLQHTYTTYYIESKDNGVSWNPADKKVIDDSGLEKWANKLVVTKNGWIHLFSTVLESGAGVIYYLRSKDQGVSWEKTMLYTDTRIIPESEVILTSNETIYFLHSGQPPSSATKRVYLQVSEDQGDTWIMNDTPVLHGLGEINQVALAARSDPNDIHVAVGHGKFMSYIHSPDGGTSWTQRKIFGSGKITGPVFVSVAVSNYDGNPTVYLAHNDVEMTLHFQRSSDNGVTWDTDVGGEINEVYLAGSANVGLAFSQSQQIYLIYHDERSSGGLQVTISHDNGVTWKDTEIDRTRSTTGYGSYTFIDQHDTIHARYFSVSNSANFLKYTRLGLCP